MHNKYLFILLILKIILVINVSTKRFHEHLSSEDLRRIFHVESPLDVPEYDITSISRSRVRRSSTSHIRTVHLQAFGNKKILNLQPNTHLSKNIPVYFADANSGLKLSSSHFNDIGIPYQDESSMTAVLLGHHPESGALLMDGTVGEDLVVRPIPYNFNSLIKAPTEEEQSQNDLYEDEAFLDDGENIEDDLVFSDGLPLIPDDESVQGASISAGVHKRFNATKEKLPDGLLLLRRRRSTNQLGFHVVYKRKAPVIDSDYAFLESEDVPTVKVENRRSKREAPYVIYPEILVLVDYDGYLLHGQDNSKIKSYYVSFWNGADLRYKLLKSPKVKVSIAGIIISRSRDAMPYLERNRVGRDAIDSASALTDMGKYLYQERRLPTYDVAVAITKYDLCRRRKSGRCTTGTAGFAYVGGACVVNKRLQKVNSVAIVEDTGGFSGIIVAAHEVGHLLGAVHDGSPAPSYLGGPGARRCRWKDGYIMSDLRHTEKGFRWSSCSVEQFQHFLNGETATCLYNLPHEDESLPRILPGKLMSLDAQCRKDRGTSACFKDDRVCAQLFCFDKTSGYCVSYRPAAEGSDCGEGKICLNGKCVYDEDNSIIDLDINRIIDNHLVESTAPVESKSKALDIVIFSKVNNDKSATKRPTATTAKPNYFDSTTRKTILKPFVTPNSNNFKQYITTQRPTVSSRTITTTTRRPTTSRRTTTTTTMRPTTTTPRRATTTTTSRPTTTITRRPTITNTRRPTTTRSLFTNRWLKTTTTNRPTLLNEIKSYTKSRQSPTPDSFNHKINQIQSTNPTTKKRNSSAFWKSTPRRYITNNHISPDIKVTTFRPKLKTNNYFTKTTTPIKSSIYTTTKKSKYTTRPWTRWLTSSKSPSNRAWPYYTPRPISRLSKIDNKESTTAKPHISLESTTKSRSHIWNNKWKKTKTKRTTKNRTTTPEYTTTGTTTTPRTTTKHINRIPVDEKTSKKSLNVVGHDFKCDDKLKKIAGGMTCQRFLQNYGYRYCEHRYIHKNCCRSRAEICV